MPYIWYIPPKKTLILVLSLKVTSSEVIFYRYKWEIWQKALVKGMSCQPKNTYSTYVFKAQIEKQMPWVVVYFCYIILIQSHENRRNEGPYEVPPAVCAFLFVLPAFLCPSVPSPSNVSNPLFLSLLKTK